jgi:hypothetical protein
MCRIEERVYITAEGHRAKFEESFPCDKSRNGRLCAKVKRRTVEFYAKKGANSQGEPTSLATKNPPGPTDSKPLIIQQRRPDVQVRQPSFRRPSISSADPTSRGRITAVKPNIIIEFGSRSNKSKKYQSASRGKEANRGPELQTDMDDTGIEFSDSDASHTFRTGFREAPLPPLQGYRVSEVVPAFTYRHTSSGESYSSGGVPSLVSSTSDDESSTYQSSVSATSRRLPPRSSGTSDIWELQEDGEGELAYTLAQEENEKQVRFELGRADRRTSERAETLLMEREKVRAEQREKRREQQQLEHELQQQRHRQRQQNRVVKTAEAHGEEPSAKDNDVQRDTTLTSTVGDIANPSRRGHSIVVLEEISDTGKMREASPSRRQSYSGQYTIQHRRENDAHEMVADRNTAQQADKLATTVPGNQDDHMIKDWEMTAPKKRLAYGQHITLPGTPNEKGKPQSLLLTDSDQSPSMEPLLPSQGPNPNYVEQAPLLLNSSTVAESKPDPESLKPDSQTSTLQDFHNTLKEEEPLQIKDGESMPQRTREVVMEAQSAQAPLETQVIPIHARAYEHGGSMSPYQEESSVSNAPDVHRIAEILQEKRHIVEVHNGPSPLPIKMSSSPIPEEMYDEQTAVLPEQHSLPIKSGHYDTIRAPQTSESTPDASSGEIGPHWSITSRPETSSLEGTRTRRWESATNSYEELAPNTKGLLQDTNEVASKVHGIHTTFQGSELHFKHNDLEHSKLDTTDEFVQRKVAPTITMEALSYTSLLDMARRSSNATLVASGLLESPLKVGHIRLRWHCVSTPQLSCNNGTKVHLLQDLTSRQKCGEGFVGDVVEYRKGGVAKLIDRMQQRTGTKVVATSYNKAVSSQRYTVQAPIWIREIFRKFSAALRGTERSSPGLPQHRALAIVSTSVLGGTDLSQQQTLHLMACMQRGRYRRTVHQDRIDNITTDQALFSFMRSQVARHRGRIRKMFSLKCVQGLYFVKVSALTLPQLTMATTKTDSSSAFEHAAVQKSATTSRAAPRL